MDDTVLTREWFKGELVAYAWTWEGGRLVKLSEADSAELAKGLVAFRDGHITAAEFHVRWGYLEDLVWRR